MKKEVILLVDNSVTKVAQKYAKAREQIMQDLDFKKQKVPDIVKEYLEVKQRQDKETVKVQ